LVRELIVSGMASFDNGGAAIDSGFTATDVVASVPATSWAAAVPALSSTIRIVIALIASWFILRGAALASRRIRLATRGPAQALWDTIGWCGKPPKDQSRTFVILSVALTLGSWILVPVLVGIALAT